VLSEKAQWNVFGKQYEDVQSMVKLSKQLAEHSRASANFVVPFHYTSAIEALTSLKQIKNPKFALEI
jgi:hypothetical protein